ncbi:MAG TPA: glycosyltransferase family 61 protein [Chryseolinea sp.]|nr:glycosyltransferase family 61 protein [Chryseolinea sp.]
MRIVPVRLPRNISDGDRHLFEPYTHFRLDELKVLHLEEIFVTYTGLCLDDKGLKSESHHNYPEKYQQLVDEALYYYTAAVDNANKLVELDDDNIYVVVHHPWSGNYWHWMSEAILRVWLVRENAQNLILVLPEHFKNTEFILSSLMPFQFKDVYYIPTGKSLLIRNLCLPQIKPICDSYDRDALLAIRNRYLVSVMGEKTKHAYAYEKVYISRRKAHRRKVVNEEEVISLLEKFGFVCITTEDYTFNEEIMLFSKVRYLISIHGSGLTNMLFMKEGSSILELHKKLTNSNDWHSFAFWYLADSLDLAYYHQICEPVNLKSSIFDADYNIDLGLLKANVQCMLGIESTVNEGSIIS